MAKIDYPYEWDQTLAVGELVTAFEPGYWVIERFYSRDDENRAPLVTCRLAVWASGLAVADPAKPRRHDCDVSHCQRVDTARVEKFFQQAVREAAIQRDNLLKFVPAQR